MDRVLRSKSLEDLARRPARALVLDLARKSASSYRLLIGGIAIQPATS